MVMVKPTNMPSYPRPWMQMPTSNVGQFAGATSEPLMQQTPSMQRGITHPMKLENEVKMAQRTSKKENDAKIEAKGIKLTETPLNSDMGRG